MEQLTRGGMITGAMFLTVQQREEISRREMLRGKTVNSEQRQATLRSNFVDRIRKDWKFRRC
eukprot:12567977-Alexandrium_andersonii.AAC.1